MISYLQKTGYLPIYMYLSFLFFLILHLPSLTLRYFLIITIDKFCRLIYVYRGAPLIIRACSRAGIGALSRAADYILLPSSNEYIFVLIFKI